MGKTVRNGRQLPYDWFAAGPESHEAAEKVRVTRCDLGADGKAPQLLLSPILLISAPKLTHGERKEGKD